MKPKFRNNTLLDRVVCDTPGCVAHIKYTGSISGPLYGDHNGPKEDHRNLLNPWSSGSSAIWRIMS